MDIGHYIDVQRTKICVDVDIQSYYVSFSGETKV